MINRFPHIQVRNEKQGFKELLRWAKAQGVNTKDALFGLEFTGYYSDALELFLTGKAICEVCGRSTLGTLIKGLECRQIPAHQDDVCRCQTR